MRVKKIKYVKIYLKELVLNAIIELEIIIKTMNNIILFMVFMKMNRPN